MGKKKEYNCDTLPYTSLAEWCGKTHAEWLDLSRDERDALLDEFGIDVTSKIQGRDY